MAMSLCAPDLCKQMTVICNLGSSTHVPAGCLLGGIGAEMSEEWIQMNKLAGHVQAYVVGYTI